MLRFSTRLVWRRPTQLAPKYESFLWQNPLHVFAGSTFYSNCPPHLHRREEIPLDSASVQRARPQDRSRSHTDLQSPTKFRGTENASLKPPPTLQSRFPPRTTRPDGAASRKSVIQPRSGYGHPSQGNSQRKQGQSPPRQHPLRGSFSERWGPERRIPPDVVSTSQRPSDLQPRNSSGYSSPKSQIETSPKVSHASEIKKQLKESFRDEGVTGRLARRLAARSEVTGKRIPEGKPPWSEKRSSMVSGLSDLSTLYGRQSMRAGQKTQSEQPSSPLQRPTQQSHQPQQRRSSPLEHPQEKSPAERIVHSPTHYTSMVTGIGRRPSGGAAEGTTKLPGGNTKTSPGASGAATALYKSSPYPEIHREPSSSRTRSAFLQVQAQASDSQSLFSSKTTSGITKPLGSLAGSGDPDESTLMSRLREAMVPLQKQPSALKKPTHPRKREDREQTRKPRQDRRRDPREADWSARYRQSIEGRQEAYEKRMKERQMQAETLPRDTFLDTMQDEKPEESSGRSTKRAGRKDSPVVLPPEDASVSELSRLFGIKIVDLIKQLEELGEDASGEDYTVDLDVAEILAAELGIKAVRPTRRTVIDSDHDQLMKRRSGGDEAAAVGKVYDALPPRPPVVCIMGHVDHGKTTLMDTLRRRAQKKVETKRKKSKKKKNQKKTASDANEDVAGTEDGGITQVISAFQVPVGDDGKSVTFLDTPGHAAFRSMRQSGSHAADIIVLVIAAEDGVSRQTIEILDFYKSIVTESGGGGISMVIAMNKIDRPGVDIEESRLRIENELLEQGIIVEGMSYESEYGPPVQLVPLSGLTGVGIEDLIEALVLQSEVMELRADDQARAEGIVMDARVDQGLGVVVDGIIRWGSIHRGDTVVSGTNWGKVKILKNVNGEVIQRGKPSQPVRVVGFKSLPKAGDPLICMSEEAAKKLVDRRIASQSNDENVGRPVSFETGELQVNSAGSFSGRVSKKVHEFRETESESEDNAPIRVPVVLKADAEGSLDALRDSLLAVGDESTFNVVVDPVHFGVGKLSATDVQMAKESGATIFCFGRNLKDQASMKLASSEGIDVRSHTIIYALLEDAKDVVSKKLPKKRVEHVHGKALVKQVFYINKGDEAVAGMQVMEGNFFKEKAAIHGKSFKCYFRVLRGGKQETASGDTVTASSLRRFKDDVDSVRRGDECGLALIEYNDFQVGDVIECYSVEMKDVFV